mmetsp:Transcript_66815/g.110615  ORF Transcript_66815/g.110615 Transcript_66815/m.110615 type:complete len:121 (-) Transcript_66815:1185-1547(-)
MMVIYELLLAASVDDALNGCSASAAVVVGAIVWLLRTESLISPAGAEEAVPGVDDGGNLEPVNVPGLLGGNALPGAGVLMHSSISSISCWKRSSRNAIGTSVVPLPKGMEMSSDMHRKAW